MDAEFVVVGAGISGLACAGALHEAGAEVLVIERSRGVGGRCATRRVEGQPVDHGVAFYHGTDPEFLAALGGAGGTVLEGWPRRVEGQGAPCQPRAFLRGETRLAYAEGVTTFPKHLARGLTLRRETRVEAVSSNRTEVRVTTDRGEVLRARAAVLALPAKQALALLPSQGDPSPDARAAAELLTVAGSIACLTLIAGYPPDAPAPGWHMRYPEESRILQSISHDSSKRSDPTRTVLVLQARPCWSRTHIERREEDWRAAMLEEAGKLVGDWAAGPVWAQSHRWRHARADGGSEFVRPLLVDRRLGIAGETFAPGSGVQAAFRAGREMARRLLQEVPG